MSVLTREQIEECRRWLTDSKMTNFDQRFNLRWNILCDMALRSPDLDAGAVNEVEVINPHVMDLVRAHGSTMTNSEIVQKFLPLQRLSACDLDAVIEATIQACANWVETRELLTMGGQREAREMDEIRDYFVFGIRHLDRSKINAAPKDEPAGLHTSAPIISGEVRTPSGAAPDVRELVKRMNKQASYLNMHRHSIFSGAATADLLREAAALLAQTAAAEEELLDIPSFLRKWPDEKPAAAGVSEERDSIDKLVDRFLSWPLPASVNCDLCVTRQDYPHGRIGTNLLTADEAKQMLEYLLAARDEGGVKHE